MAIIWRLAEDSDVFIHCMTDLPVDDDVADCDVPLLLVVVLLLVFVMLDEDGYTVDTVNDCCVLMLEVPVDMDTFIGDFGREAYAAEFLFFSAPLLFSSFSLIIS